MIPIPANYRALAIGVAALLVFAAGGILGIKATAAHYGPQLDKANQALGEYRNAYGALAAATARQNDAIENLQAEAAVREKTAREAAEAARRAAQPKRDQAAAILALKPPAGVDQCTAARESFDAELRQERGAR